MINVSRTQKDVENRTAWRIEGTLREFPKFPPVNLWFDYPIHRVDGSEVLKDLSAGADMPTWNKTWKQNFRQKKTSEDRKKEAKESLETAFSAVAMDGGKAKISEVSEYLGVTEKTVRNRLKNDKDFWVDDGWCGLK